MHTATKKKIQFLQEYMAKHHKGWLAKHKDNIVGFHIGKKNKTSHYSIIFHVCQKIGKEKLSKSQLIPKWYDVKFPDGSIKGIKTDVEQTGTPRFHLAVCKKPRNNGNTEIGTIGVYAADDAGSTYGITNYHVAAKDRMIDQEFHFTGSDRDIKIDGKKAIFTEGIFSSELDVAFIEVPSGMQVSNTLPDGASIKGYIDGPITPNAIGKDVTVYSRKKDQAKVCMIHNNEAIFVTGFQDLSLIKLLQIDPVFTLPGDSGGPVVIGDAIIGIIVGADDLYDYAIPYHKIQDFKPLAII